MKLAGYKKKGRHLQKNVSGNAENGACAAGAVRSAWYRRMIPKSIIMKIVLGLSLCIVAAIAALAVDIIFKNEVLIKPPPVDEDPRRPAVSETYDPTLGIPPPVQTDWPEPGETDEPAVSSLRKPNNYTFLVFGTDGQANTDVIMTVTFDADNYKLNVVSIPRDTMTNVEWNVKKAYQIVYNMRRQFRGEDDADNKAMQGVKETFADILGYRVDYWITIDMKGFVALINAIGGVDFYVPVNMTYNDPAQSLNIQYTKGMKYGLTGQQVLEIIRFRSGYASKDIGRIETQQLLLKATAEQLLAKKSSLNIVSLADTFLKYVKTDLALNNVVWLGKELLKMDAENVHFVTMPGNNLDSVNGSSYVSIYVDEWLEMVNTLLNPLNEDIKVDDLSILTRGADRRLYVTDGNRLGDPAWGATSRGPSVSGSTSGGGTTSGAGGSTSGSSGNTGGAPSPSPSASPSETPGSNSDNNEEQSSGSSETETLKTDSGGDDTPADNQGAGNTDHPADPPQQTEPAQSSGSSGETA